MNCPQPEPEPECNISSWNTELTVDNEINEYTKQMKYYRNIRISGSEFDGYIYPIDIRYIDNLDDIINNVKNELIKIFSSLNMNDLVDKVKNTRFHIHSHTLDEILINKVDVYLCTCTSD
tara:strand:+ start:192 stop:551 length:360 start_codon:yes stop_codon:yes gene_type:complete